MFKQKVVPISLIVIFMITVGCFNDSEDKLYGQNTCDTTSMSYSQDIVPIIDAYCITCHNQSNAGSIGGNVILEDYTNLKIYVDNGDFLSSVLHDGNASPMPKGGSKLSDCEIEKISAWISAGSLDN
jgi:hypothetical protein